MQGINATSFPVQLFHFSFPYLVPITLLLGNISAIRFQLVQECLENNNDYYFPLFQRDQFAIQFYCSTTLKKFSSLFLDLCDLFLLFSSRERRNYQCIK